MDLPVEITPIIIQYLMRPQHIAYASLVNKTFYSYAIPMLYERTVIYAWHKEGKKRATLLIETLASCPHLARYVQKLELRDFPKGLPHDRAQILAETCVTAIRNCANLRACVWTRDGTLNDDILEALSDCPHLDSLEINGHDTRNYDPVSLTRFLRLRKVAIIMPSHEVLQALSACFQINNKTLESLTLVCKSTKVVTDATLKSMAPSLANLKQLHIAGCTGVTHHGVMNLLAENSAGLTDLALEGLSPSFDMESLSRFSQRTSCFAQLESITLAFPKFGVSNAWLAQVEHLLWNAPIWYFHLYASGGHAMPPIPLDELFVQNLIRRHGARLTRLAILRLPLSTHSLDFVVRNCTKLEQLFVSMWRYELCMLGPIIHQSHTLRSLHVSYPTMSSMTETGEIDSDEGEVPALGRGAEWSEQERGGTIGANHPLPSMEDLESIALQFQPCLRQFGIQTRVWQVEQCTNTDFYGKIYMTVRLGPYESPDVPDAFLVVRT